MLPERTDGGRTDGGHRDLPARRVASGSVAVPAPLPPDAGVTDLVGGIAKDTQRIVSGYLDLAKHDLRSELRHAIRAVAAGSVAAGALLVGAVILAMSAAFGIAGEGVMSLPWSLLLVGVIVVIASGVLIAVAVKSGSKAKEAPPALREAKEDLKWIKENV